MKFFVTFLILILFYFVKSQNPDQISIALVIDATGSMAAEIDAAKDVCNQILSNFYNNGKQEFISNYVLSVFRDPDVGPLINSANPKNIENKLKVTAATGGGDTPELSITGIREALKHTLPKSFMFVFTDAPPKDAHLKDTVLNQLRAKQIKVSFFLSPGGSSDVYDDIARGTSGLVLNLKAADIKSTLETFTKQFQDMFVPLVVIHKEPGKHTSSFDVSADDTELIIQTNAETLIVYDPDRVRYEPKTIGIMKYLEIPNPKPGKYDMITESVKKYSAVIGAISKIKFLYGFSLSQVKLKDKTITSPIGGEKNYLTVFISGDGDLKELNSVIFTVNGKTDIKNLTKVTDKIYRTDLIDFPDELFKMTISGEDATGNKIYRVLSNSILPVLPDREPLKDDEAKELENALKKKFPPKLIKSLKENKISLSVMKYSLTDFEINIILKNYNNNDYFVFKKKIRKFCDKLRISGGAETITG